MFVRFNLLSDDQLAGIGFSKEEVELIRKNRPLDSLVDLLFVKGVDAQRAIPRLIGQGVLVSLADRVLLPRDRLLALMQDAGGGNGDGEEDDSDDDDAPGATNPAILASGEGWSITSTAGDMIGVIADCTTTRTFQVRATKGAIQGVAGNRDYDRFRVPTETQATDGAKQRLSFGIAAIIAGCECTNPNCLNQVVRVMRNQITFSYTNRYRGPLPKPRVRGWEARAVATATVTITCQ